MNEKEELMTIINEMRDLAGAKSDSALCLMAGLNKGTLGNLRKHGNISLPRNDTLNKFAKVIGYDNFPDYLLKRRTGENYIIYEVPMTATAPGGSWLETIDHPTYTITYASKVKGNFKGVKIIGNSINKLIDDGGIAIVDVNQNDPSLLSDQLVIVECNGEVTAKVYRINPERFEPYSNDPGFKSIFPNQECKIIGRVVDSVKRIPKRIP